MRMHVIVAVVFVCVAGPATPALAQRFPFERSFDVSERSSLDVSTIRGKIDITVGAPGQVVVTGNATVRIGLTLPANAVDIARRVASAPPIERDGKTIRLRPPAGEDERRAVTVNYQVRVPPETEVSSVSDSGATTVHGVAGHVVVRTQSGAIELAGLGATAAVTTGSGAVAVDGVAGALSVITSSSGFTGRALRSGLHVRTGSGAVDAAFTGSGDVDVQTASSAIRLRGVNGAVTASSQSGRVSVEGVPSRPWQFSTGSGSMDIVIPPDAALTLDASSRSGSVTVRPPVQGSVSKRNVNGTIGGGGPLVHVTSRSGSVVVTVAE
jgi:Putative adhesin